MKGGYKIYIHKLDFTNTEICDLGVIELACECTELTHLDLWGTKITNISLDILAKKCRKLKSLNVGSTKIDGIGLISFKQKLPNCQILY